MTETLHDSGAENVPPVETRVTFEPCAYPPCTVRIPFGEKGDWLYWNGQVRGLIIKDRIEFRYCAVHTRVGRS